MQDLSLVALIDMCNVHLHSILDHVNSLTDPKTVSYSNATPSAFRDVPDLTCMFPLRSKQRKTIPINPKKNFVSRLEARIRINPCLQGYFLTLNKFVSQQLKPAIVFFYG